MQSRICHEILLGYGTHHIYIADMLQHRSYCHGQHIEEWSPGEMGDGIEGYRTGEP
ncbi:Uncharacterised protein [Segatella copri]|nr:Uncharacterised protein [Segatella copri]